MRLVLGIVTVLGVVGPIAVFGVFMAPIGWGYAAFVWG